MVSFIRLRDVANAEDWDSNQAGDFHFMGFDQNLKLSPISAPDWATS